MENFDTYKDYLLGLKDLSGKCKKDPDLAKRLQENPANVLERHDLTPDTNLRDYDVNVVFNTDKVLHIIMPPRPSSAEAKQELADYQMSDIAGGTRVSSAGSVACGSTAGSVPSTVSSMGTISTGGCACSH